jgi:hypothetical protein
MVQINKRKVSAVVALVLAGLLAFGLLASAAAPAQASPRSAAKTSRQAYQDEWRKLWEDHITWTRVVIMGVLNELPGT